MEHSQELDKVGPALAKAQAEMGGAKKSANNPFFKSKYADLAEVWKACKEALHENGLSVIQSPISEDGRIGVSTMLLHSSGQFVKDSYTLGVKKANDPQADGSSITYARRYALAAFVGVCPEDDDGEKAMARKTKGEKKSEKTVKDADVVAKYVESMEKEDTVEKLDDWQGKMTPYISKLSKEVQDEIWSKFDQWRDIKK